MKTLANVKIDGQSRTVVRGSHLPTRPTEGISVQMLFHVRDSYSVCTRREIIEFDNGRSAKNALEVDCVVGSTEMDDELSNSTE